MPPAALNLNPNAARDHAACFIIAVIRCTAETPVTHNLAVFKLRSTRPRLPKSLPIGAAALFLLTCPSISRYRWQFSTFTKTMPPPEDWPGGCPSSSAYNHRRFLCWHTRRLAGAPGSRPGRQNSADPARDASGRPSERGAERLEGGRKMRGRVVLHHSKAGAGAQSSTVDGDRVSNPAPSSRESRTKSNSASR